MASSYSSAFGFGSSTFGDAKTSQLRNQSVKQLTSIAEFIQLLENMPINGPRYIWAFPLDTRNYKLIGQGAQFEVFKNTNEDDPVVFKRVRLENFESARKDRQSHLRTIELEIRVLCNDKIRNHVNIVRVQEWGYDYPSWTIEDPIPVLIVEKALYSLDKLLEESPWHGSQDQLDLKARYQLCLDIAAGLECLRECEIVHGDIKPQNILIFDQQNSEIPLIAKLGDFGLSLVLESSDDLSFMSYQSTPGWKPPETMSIGGEKEYPFHPQLLFMCDSYSYGLTALSILIFDGASPIDKIKSDSVVYEESIPSTIQKLAFCVVEDLKELRGPDEDFAKILCRKICSSFLDSDPGHRPDVSPEKMDYMKHEHFSKWEANHVRFMSRSSTSSRIGPGRQKYSYWMHLSEQVLPLLQKDREDLIAGISSWGIPSDVLFGMALSHLAQVRGSRDRALQLFFEAASHDAPSLAARNLLPWLYDALESSWLSENAQIVQDMLFDATCTGSLANTPVLGLMDRSRYEEARNKFRTTGGYNKESFKQFIGLSPSQLPTGIVDEKANTMLHYAATIGRIDIAELFMAKQSQLVNQQNIDGETALYKACLSGNYNLTKFLINAGADPSLAETTFGRSCLHWLFNFEVESIPPVAELLIRHRAKIDARIKLVKDYGLRRRITFEHFPFYWPYGTPLHWACSVGSIAAAQTLLDLGASINAVDVPEDIRSHTPLALAMYQGDSTTVSFLVNHGADTNLADSKGFTPLHMLAGETHMVCRNGYAFKPFIRWCSHGSYERSLKETRRCVNAIRDHGANLNARCELQHTPLMHAISSHDACTVLALLEAGAGANVTNDMPSVRGQLPLHLWVGADKEKLAYPRSYFDVLEALMSHTTDCRATDQESNTVLHAAVLNAGDLQFTCELVRNILRRPEFLRDINARNKRGETALLRAIQIKTCDSKGLAELIAVLQEYGADIRARDNYNCDLLWFITNNEHIGDLCCKQFMEKYLANFDMKSRRDRLNNSRCSRTGRTALMHLAFQGYEECIKFCLELKVDLNVKSVLDCWTALDFAFDQGNMVRHKFLKRWAMKQMEGVTPKSEKISREFWSQGPFINSLNFSSQHGNNRDLYFAAPKILRALLDAGGTQGGGVIDSPRAMDRNFLEVSKYDWFVPEQQPYYEIWADFYDLDDENPLKNLKL